MGELAEMDRRAKEAAKQALAREEDLHRCMEEDEQRKQALKTKLVCVA